MSMTDKPADAQPPRWIPCPTCDGSGTVRADAPAANLFPALPHHPEPHTMNWTRQELDAIKRYGAACFAAGESALAAQAKPAPAVPPAAWMHPDGRIVPAETMDSALRSGGAPLTALRGHTIPLYAGAASAPEGWQLVPIKPTEAMTNAADDWLMSPANHRSGGMARGSGPWEVYRVMLAASPQVAPAPAQPNPETAP